MANIKELKKRIKSTKSTLKITSAMKLVSAAKLARAQQAIVGSRPYAAELSSTIKTTSALVADYSHDFLLEKKNNNRAILLVISSDKGLCGGYNSGVAKEVRKFKLANPNLDLRVHFIGKKAKELLKKDVNIGHQYKFNKAYPTFEEIKEIATELSHLFSTNEVGSVYVAYNIFRSAIAFESKVVKVLPLTLAMDEAEKVKKEYPFDFKYDPSAAHLLDKLIPQAYTTSVYTCLLDAVASEHGSRMSSMDSATKNCKEMIKTLTLTMNMLRQAAITTELIEVVSGAEALNA